MNDYMKEHNYPQFVSIQDHYNLIYREDERELFTFAHENNLGLTPYSPLASGRRLEHKLLEESKIFFQKKISMVKLSILIVQLSMK